MCFFIGFYGIVYSSFISFSDNFKMGHTTTYWSLLIKNLKGEKSKLSEILTSSEICEIHKVPRFLEI